MDLLRHLVWVNKLVLQTLLVERYLNTAIIISYEKHKMNGDINLHLRVVFLSLSLNWLSELFLYLSLCVASI